MHLSRLFEIVYILLDRESVTAGELARRFEVSRRTIYRDLDTLCQAGVPICTKNGKGGGVSLLKSFVLNKSVLSKEEQKEILSALKGLSAVSETGRALSRLSALFGGESADWIEVDFSDWSGAGKETFAEIKKAILERKVLRFEYYSSAGEKTERSAEPMKLLFKERSWYLLGYCLLKGDLRTFKLSRIKNLSATGECFERTADSPVPLWQPPASAIVVLKLWLPSSQAFRVYDEFLNERIEKNPDGSFTVTASYPEGDWIYSHILSFGPNIKVLEPSYIAEGVKHLAEKIFDMYP